MSSSARLTMPSITASLTVELFHAAVAPSTGYTATVMTDSNNYQACNVSSLVVNFAFCLFYSELTLF